MCKICIFAGTTEARRLVELLSTQPVSVTACVATEYGETLLPEGGNVTVRSGRIPVDGIIQMLSDCFKRNRSIWNLKSQYCPLNIHYCNKR